MRQLLELLGFIALVQGVLFIALVRGVLGLVHEFAPRHAGLVQRLGFLDGYEVYASVAPVVPAFAPFAAAGSRRSG
ncbi:hypothetical protein [Streptomyces sp. NPDC001315]|uniref:hypothetical protein n=1 Tax=Streptomyces sp. NPDC001315 TaxID=3364562 RepID=UPI00368E2A59